MKRNNKLLFLILLLSVTGFFSIVAFQSLSSVDAITGKDIYRLNCAGCHGADRKGQANLYPSLININSYFGIISPFLTISKCSDNPI